METKTWNKNAQNKYQVKKFIKHQASELRPLLLIILIT